MKIVWVSSSILKREGESDNVAHTFILLVVPSNHAADIPATFPPLPLIERDISSVWRHGERDVYPSVAYPLRKLPYYNLDRYYVVPRPSVRTNYPYSISPALFTLLSHYFLVSGCPGLFLSPPPDLFSIARRQRAALWPAAGRGDSLGNGACGQYGVVFSVSILWQHNDINLQMVSLHPPLISFGISIDNVFLEMSLL